MSAIHDVGDRPSRAGAQSGPFEDDVVLRIYTTEAPSIEELKDSTSVKTLVPFGAATPADHVALLFHPMTVMSSTINWAPFHVVDERSEGSKKAQKGAQKGLVIFQGKPLSRSVSTGTMLEIHPWRCDERRLVFFSDASLAQGRAGMGVAWHMDNHWSHFAVPVPVPYGAGPGHFDLVERVELEAVELAFSSARIWIRNNFDREDIAIEKIFIYTDCRGVLRRFLDQFGDRTGQDELRDASRNRDYSPLEFHLSEKNRAKVPRVPWLQNSNQMAADEAWRSPSDHDILNRIMSTAQEIKELYNAESYIEQSAGHSGIEGNERADRAAVVGRAARSNGRDLPNHTLLWNRESPAQQVQWLSDPLLSQSSWTVVDGNRTFPVDVPLAQALRGPTIMSPNIASLQSREPVRR